MKMIAGALIVVTLIVVDFASDLAVHAGKISGKDDHAWDVTTSVALGAYAAWWLFHRGDS